MPGGLTRVALRQRFAGGEFVARRRKQGHLGSAIAESSTRECNHALPRCRQPVLDEPLSGARRAYRAPAGREPEPDAGSRAASARSGAGSGCWPRWAIPPDLAWNGDPDQRGADPDFRHRATLVDHFLHYAARENARQVREEIIYRTVAAAQLAVSPGHAVANRTMSTMRCPRTSCSR